MVQHGPNRERLSETRKALTHRFEIEGHKGYVIVGLYDDGRPGEVFFKMAKMGSTVSGLLDEWAITISLALQYGVPITILCRKHIGNRYEPYGRTVNPEIAMTKSIGDYIFRWLEKKFVLEEERTLTDELALQES